MHSVVAVAFQSEEEAFFKKGTPATYFGPAMNPPLDGSGRKTTALVRNIEYIIHTKFHQNPSSSSGEEDDNVNCLTDGRMEGRCTDDRRRTTRDHKRSLEPSAPVP